MEHERARTFTVRLTLASLIAILLLGPENGCYRASREVGDIVDSVSVEHRAFNHAHAD